jgi:hypothetical protein
MEEKKNKIYISTLIIFWLVFAFFILNISSIWLIPLIISSVQFINIALMIILSILGIVLIILAARANFNKVPKAFFILTGSSATGITVFGVLHNLLFALLIKLLGENFSARMGDEPVFFILATILCPIALLVGILGCIIIIAGKKIKLQN